MGYSQVFQGRSQKQQDLETRRPQVQREDANCDWILPRQKIFHDTRFPDGDSDGTVHLPETQEMTNMQRFMQCDEQRQYFNPVSACYRAPIDSNPYSFHGVETQNPWSHRPLLPSVPSPFCSQGDHRSPIDQDSLSSGSVWSPRTNETNLDYDSASDCRISTPCDGLGYSSDHHIYPAFAVNSSGGGSTSFRVIAPSEVQIYPDAEADADADREEYCSEPKLQEGTMNAPYYNASPDLAHHQAKPERPTHEEDGIGSSINDGSTDSPLTEDDDIEMEDKNDEDTDYKPSKSSSTRRTSRASNGGNKSPLTQRRASKKVTKCIARSPSKNWTHSPTTKTTSTPEHHGSQSQISPSINPSQTNKNHCHHCRQFFQSPSALNKHIQSSHTRPFTCTFARYGCPSTFGSKNEWKRHVTSQHLRPGIWRCDIGACVPRSTTARRSNGRKTSLGEESWNEFNRKDLFTQHVRRMHGPATTAPRAEREKFEVELEAMRRRCWKMLHEAPPRSVCGFCLHAQRRNEHDPPEGERAGEDEKRTPVYEGKMAWEERMEHVGRHLEKQASEEDEDEDVALREWMVQEKLLFWERGAWRVVGVPEGKKQVKREAGMDDGEEDAEGDDE